MSGTANNPTDPAFAHSASQQGLTMRQYIAAKALQGLLAHDGTIAGDKKCSPEALAKKALECADALIAELGKP